MHTCSSDWHPPTSRIVQTITEFDHSEPVARLKMVCTFFKSTEKNGPVFARALSRVMAREDGDAWQTVCSPFNTTHHQLRRVDENSEAPSQTHSQELHYAVGML